MAQHMERVGKNLSTANAAYNQMVGSFESQVLTQAKRFEGLGPAAPRICHPRRWWRQRRVR
jgi:DNA recombination protein RmuC